MMNRNEMTEEKYRLKHRWGRRLLALVLAAALLGGMLLAWAVQIRDLELQFVGTVLEQAKRVTNNNTAYLDQPTLERAWRVLKTVISKPDTYEEYDTYASLAIAKGDYAGAVQYMQGCIDTYSGDDARELALLWLRKGSLFTLTEQPEAAIECYDKSLELNPGMADACLLRAQMRSELGMPEEAAEDLIRYQELAGENPVIQAALGSLYESIGNYSAAVKCYTLSVESGSYETSVLASRGRCRILNGDTAGAKNDLERFFREGGEDSGGDIWAMLGMCRLEAGENAGAIEAFHSAIDLGYRDSLMLYGQCISAAMAEEDYGTVEKDSGNAIRLAEESGWDEQETAQFYQWQGFGYFGQQKFKEAADALEKALERNSNLESAHYYAGVCYMSQEESENAIRHFRASAARGEYGSTCLYNSALCNIQLERYQEAVNDLRSAMEIHDDEKAAAQAEAVLRSLEDAMKQMEG